MENILRKEIPAIELDLATMKKIMLQEGNEFNFYYKGFHCCIIRIMPKDIGHLCGYIDFPKGHYLYGLTESQIEQKYGYELPAHGGLTHSHPTKGVTSVGITCAQRTDFIPYGVSYLDQCHATYKTMAFVENNLKQIIDYILAFE